ATSFVDPLPRTQHVHQHSTYESHVHTCSFAHFTRSSSKCDTCPSSPSSLPTFHACLDHPIPHVSFYQYSLSGQRPCSPQGLLQTLSSPESFQRDPLPNRPIPNRPQMVHPSFPANVSLYAPASRCIYGRFHEPNPATSKPRAQRKPQTSQDYARQLRLVETPAKHSAALLMVAPKTPRPIIRGEIGFDSIHHTRLLSVWQFRTNSAPSSAVFSVRFAGDGYLYNTVTGENPVHTRHETVQEVEHNPRHVQPNQSCTKTNTQNNNTTKLDSQAPGPITPA
ncbi:hypothetical protein JB92DRAFT_2996004, partial [Gautieria morchelliformis]